MKVHHHHIRPTRCPTARWRRCAGSAQRPSSRRIDSPPLEAVSEGACRGGFERSLLTEWLVLEGRVCNAFGGVTCCLPCPMTDWVYPDNFGQLTSVANWLCVAGMIDGRMPVELMEILVWWNMGRRLVFSHRWIAGSCAIWFPGLFAQERRKGAISVVGIKKL